MVSKTGLQFLLVKPGVTTQYKRLPWIRKWGGGIAKKNVGHKTEGKKNDPTRRGKTASKSQSWESSLKNCHLKGGGRGKDGGQKKNVAKGGFLELRK